MSFFTNSNTRPRVESFSDTFTTTVVNFFPAIDKGLKCIRIVIDNQDPTNEITFTKNGRGGTVFTLPPNSLAIIENEVLDGVRIIPDATTGLGQFSADLVSVEALLKGGFLA